MSNDSFVCIFSLQKMANATTTAAITTNVLTECLKTFYVNVTSSSFNDSFHSSVMLNTANMSLLDRILTTFCAICYIIIMVLGWLGNGLVIYVVLCYAKMKTVTNTYILNLAISDVFFIFSLPFLTTTTILKHWVFGLVMCKIYFIQVSINLFTCVFTLTVMSFDRYLAVCHPIRYQKYSTSRMSLLLCFSTWFISFLVMMPIIMYSTTVKHRVFPEKYTCAILWPDGRIIPPDEAFIWYGFLLGFAIPVSLIVVFYVLVIVRLRQVGPHKKSKARRKSRRRVTRMVLAVISVYVSCWLPYWIFQAYITFSIAKSQTLIMWKVILFNVFTVLTFTNSMLNPVLYAFFSENFRKSFDKAFKCVSPREVNKSLYHEDIVRPKFENSHNRSSVRHSATSTIVERRLQTTSTEGVIEHITSL